jgi:hypothetical protein
MTGTELQAIRQALGLKLWEFGQALGYKAKNRNALSGAVKRMESGVRGIPEDKAARAIELKWSK